MPLDLITSSTIAQLLKVSQTYVNRLAQSGELPRADGVLNSGQRVWLRSTIEQWAATSGDRVRPGPVVEFPRSSTMARLQRSGYIRVGVVSGLPRFSDRVSEDGDLEGLEVDLSLFLASGIFGMDVGNLANYVDFVDVPISGRGAAIVNGVVDLVVANFAVTRARMENVAFAGPYLASSHAPLVTNPSLVVERPEQLQGLRVGVVGGTTDIISLMQIAPKVDVVEFPSFLACTSALTLGAVDACWVSTTAYLGLGANDRSLIKQASFRHGLEHWAVGVPRRDESFQQFVSHRMTEMFASGYFAESVNRWLGAAGTATWH